MKQYGIFILSFALLFAMILSACVAQGVEPEATAPEVPHITLREQENNDPLGITLTATDVTPTGLLLLCKQAGGQPTGELLSGNSNDFWLERNVDGQWVAVEPLPQQHSIVNTCEGVLITMDGDTDYTVSWDLRYGSLPDGSYRLGKEVMDLRAAGDYDTHTYYAPFEIAELQSQFLQKKTMNK